MAAQAPRSALASRSSRSTMAIRVPGSAMAPRGSRSAMATWGSRSAMATGAPDPPWRLPQYPCPASASRVPTLPRRCFCYGAGCAIWEGEVMSRICLSSYPANHHYLHSPAPDFTWAPIKCTCTSSHPHHLSLHKHQHQSTSSSSLVQTPLDSLTASLPSCCIDSVTNLLCHPQRVVLVLSPPHRLSVLQHSSRIPRDGSIHDLLELKDTTGLICSSPVEVSSYPLLTCFLLFTWLLSIKWH